MRCIVSHLRIKGFKICYSSANLALHRRQKHHVSGCSIKFRKNKEERIERKKDIKKKILLHRIL